MRSAAPRRNAIKVETSAIGIEPSFRRREDKQASAAVYRRNVRTRAYGLERAIGRLRGTAGRKYSHAPGVSETGERSRQMRAFFLTRRNAATRRALRFLAFLRLLGAAIPASGATGPGVEFSESQED